MLLCFLYKHFHWFAKFFKIVDLTCFLILGLRQTENLTALSLRVRVFQSNNKGVGVLVINKLIMTTSTPRCVYV